MGGLKSHFPITYWTFLIAALAISGAPLTAGFFSKDQILWLAFAGAKGSFWLWLVGWLTAGLTAFYMFRQFFLVFHGYSRATEDVRRRIHESPIVMTLPLILLALGSTLAGWLGTPEFMGGSWWDQWFGSFFPPHGEAAHGDLSTELLLLTLTVGIAVSGAGLAYSMYARANQPCSGLTPGGVIYNLVLNKYYVDEFYEIAFVRPLTRCALWLNDTFDLKGIDGMVNGVAGFIWSTGLRWRRLQSGYVQHYLFVFLLGTLLILGYYALG